MADSTLGAILAMFDAVSDGVCVADAKGDVLYMNAAARTLLDLRGRAPGVPKVCDLLCGQLELHAGKYASPGCPLQEPDGKAQSATFLGRHGPHAAYSWRPEGVARSQAWKDVRVRCLRSRMPLGGLDQEIHLVFLENAAPEMELKRHRADWRNMVAHDLRAPLTSIFGALRLLEEIHPHRPGGPQDQDAQLVRMSVDACRRMMELLDLYLDVARLDAEAMTAKLEDAGLAAPLDKAAALQAPLAAAAGVAVTVTVPEGLKARVDLELFERVAGNLLDNAVKYNVPGGRVDVTARAAAEGVELVFADTGRGIAEQDLPRVFDRYYQAEARRAGRTRGSGLGLTFCKEALELMGGTIAVESKLGQGSTFRVLLRRAEGA